jgi:hypothetical protein
MAFTLVLFTAGLAAGTFVAWVWKDQEIHGLFFDPAAPDVLRRPTIG